MIEKIIIKRFKKLKDIEITLNKDLNIIVGQNEEGKTTIMEALDMTINCHNYFDTHALYQLLNYEDVNNFKVHKNLETLPYVLVEVYFFDEESDISQKLYGRANSNNELKSGITLNIQFNSEYYLEAREFIREGIIPIEYYNVEHIGFGGQSINYMSKHPKFSLINVDGTKGGYKNFYRSTISEIRKNKEYINESLSFRKNHGKNSLNIVGDIDLQTDESKIDLFNALSYYENGEKIENKGSGREILAKTEVILHGISESRMIVGIEEPENHLSHTNLKKFIKDLCTRFSEKQIIITTHSNLITTGLGLKNVIILENNFVLYLNGLSPDTEEYFKKLDKNSLLEFILAKKNILVEGRAEYIMLQNESFSGGPLEDINVISCDGIQYNRYLEISNSLGKKTLVITDNDGKDSNLEKIGNSGNCSHYITMDRDIKMWTFEVSLYFSNEETLKRLINFDSKAQYFKGKIINGSNITYEDQPVLRKMLVNSNKADHAIMLSKENDIVTPAYIVEGLEWLRN